MKSRAERGRRTDARHGVDDELLSLMKFVFNILAACTIVAGPADLPEHEQAAGAVIACFVAPFQQLKLLLTFRSGNSAICCCVAVIIAVSSCRSSNCRRPSPACRRWWCCRRGILSYARSPVEHCCVIERRFNCSEFSLLLPRYRIVLKIA